MPCLHKFFGHQAHMIGENGLLPNWKADTLIIGTFNPSNEWVPNNGANYFYGRSRNYFWKILPKFGCHYLIDRQAVNQQIAFLERKRIAVTDLLVSIEDADINNLNHLRYIRTFLDADFNNFNQLNWNTRQIIRYIENQKIKAVYFTKLGGYGVFEQPMLEIENFCNQNNVLVHRLHTPTGQGLRNGFPRQNKLIHRWFEQGGNQFPFLCPDFDINNIDFSWHI